MEIDQKMYKGIVEYLEQERRKGVHVSNIKYPCLRRGYYDIAKPRNYDWETAWKFFIGSKVHEVPLEDEEYHEIELEWNEILGSCDEYDPDQKMVYDKKITDNPPHYNKKYARDQDQKQVSYYAVMLEAAGYPVEKGMVLYLDKSKDKPNPVKKPVDLPDDLSEDGDTAKEMIRKKDVIKQALKSKTPPHRNPNDWLCRYCDHFRTCYMED